MEAKALILRAGCDCSRNYFEMLIVFTGDVLNTAARIQGLCNAYNVDNLLSRELISKLSLHTPFQIQALGENALRGRDEKIELFTVTVIN